MGIGCPFPDFPLAPFTGQSLKSTYDVPTSLTDMDQAQERSTYVRANDFSIICLSFHYKNGDGWGSPIREASKGHFRSFNEPPPPVDFVCLAKKFQ